MVPIIHHLTFNQYTIISSSDFANEIHSEVDDSMIMTSVDVEFLFTNLTLFETSYIITDGLSGHFLTHSGINKNTKQWVHQLVLVMLNAFLCHHEVTWLQLCPPEVRPIFYILVLFKHKSHVEKFLNYLNTQHSQYQVHV